jgi:hypothetical protein
MAEHSGDLDKEIDGKKKGWATQSIKVEKLVRNCC